jgi:YaiO family outer membrane protein
MSEHMFSKRSLFFTGIASLAIGGAAMAQTANQGLSQATPTMMPTTPVPSDAGLQRNLELSTGFQNLSGGFGSWRDVTLRGTYGLPSHVLQGEVSVNRRFNKDGTFVGLSDTYTFNEDWYGSVALGFGDGAFYLPRYRVDATLYRKFLPDRSLIGSVGVGYYKAPDGHTDSSTSLGLVYYFAPSWIAEGGVRFNSSNPGSIKTQQQFAALTYGQVKQDLITVRYAWGGEGYQTIATNAQLVNFASREGSLSWRHWLNPRTGVVVGANRYTNPFYNRSGLTIGIFHDF